jgi:hypothetical protein
VRDKLLVSRRQRSCAARTAPSAKQPGFHSDRRFIPRTGALVHSVSPRFWISAESACLLGDGTDPTAEAFLYESERSDAKYISTASIFKGVRRKWSRNARSDEVSSYHQRQPALRRLDWSELREASILVHAKLQHFGLRRLSRAT